MRKRRIVYVKRFLGLATLIFLAIGLVGCGGSSPASTPAYTISGRVTDSTGNGIQDVTVSFAGGKTGTTATDSTGNWSVTNLKGTVTVTPIKQGWSFTPNSRVVKSASQNVDFTGAVFSLEALIDSAKDGDIIVVPPGEYGDGVSPINLTDKDITLRSTDPTDPNIVATTIINGGVTLGTRSGGAVLEGFTIRNASVGVSVGAFLSATIRNNVIENCYSSGIRIEDGSGIPITVEGNTIEGGISLSRTGGTIRNNIIRNGGISADYFSGIIADNTISNNRRGISLYYSSPTITRNVISNNVGPENSHGVGIYAGTGAFPIIVDNKITDNGGSGIRLDSLDTKGEYVIRGNEISRNTATWSNGGGICICWPGSSVVLTGNQFTENHSGQRGGAVYNNGSALVDDTGNPLTVPDALNTYSGNTPEDIYWWKPGGVVTAEASSF